MQSLCWVPLCNNFNSLLIQLVQRKWLRLAWQHLQSNVIWNLVGPELWYCWRYCLLVKQIKSREPQSISHDIHTHSNGDGYKLPCSHSWQEWDRCHRALGPPPAGKKGEVFCPRKQRRRAPIPRQTPWRQVLVFLYLSVSCSVTSAQDTRIFDLRQKLTSDLQETGIWIIWFYLLCIQINVTPNHPFLAAPLVGFLKCNLMCEVSNKQIQLSFRL